MSTSDDAAPAPDVASPRRRGPTRLLIAVAIVALVVTVAAVAILPRLTASRPSSTIKLGGGVQFAALQTLSLAMLGDSPTASNQPGLGSLDPAGVFDGNDTESQFVHLLFDGLVTLDDANTIEMWGADQITVSPDGLTYTFHVRENQSFSDGTPVKPSDYAWSINRALNPCIASLGPAPSPSQNMGLAIIKDGFAFATENCASDHKTAQGAIKTLIGDSIVADDSTGALTITLGIAAGYFLDILAQPDASVVERRAMNGLGTDGVWIANLSTGPTGKGGSGMFYLAARSDTGNFVLKPNPHWWGRSAGRLPHFTELDVHLYLGGTSEYVSYTNAPADYLDTVPGSYLAGAATRSDYHVALSLEVESVAFNWHLAPFDNADVRQALCLALNRDAFSQQFAPSAEVGGASMLLTPSWHLVPEGMPGYNAQLTGIDGVTATSGNLAEAQTHWQAYLATLHGRAVPPVVYTYSGALTSQTMLANAVVAEWTNAFPGLKASVVPYYPGGPILAGPVTVQVFRFAWLADYADPQDFLSNLYSTGGAYNTFGTSVPSADALLASADAISDPAELAARMGVYHQAEQQLVQQVATCPLFQHQNAYLLGSAIKGMRQNGLGYFADDDWTMGYRAA